MSRARDREGEEEGVGPEVSGAWGDGSDRAGAGSKVLGGLGGLGDCGAGAEAVSRRRTMPVREFEKKQDLPSPSQITPDI
jgi:hypothetical protein